MGLKLGMKNCEQNFSLPGCTVFLATTREVQIFLLFDLKNQI
jgi:hypothetical protein